MLRRSAVSVALVLLAILVACTAGGVPQQETSVPNGATVSLIADVEGCRVYRVSDGTFRTIYVTTGRCVVHDGGEK